MGNGSNRCAPLLRAFVEQMPERSLSPVPVCACAFGGERGAAGPDAGQLRGEGGQSLPPRLPLPWLDPCDQQLPGHDLSLGEDPRPGRRLWRLLDLRSEYRFLGISSYRDPQSAGDVEELRCHFSRFLRELELPEEERVRAIIGTIGDMDAYLLPDAKGWTALVRYLSGITDEERQRVRDEIFSTTQAHFRQFAEVLEQVARAGEIVALSAPETIEKLHRQQELFQRLIRVL
jgi:hypothetical protein